MSKASKGWTRLTVDTAKAAVDADLATAGADRRARLEHCLARLAESSSMPLSAAETYVWALRALALYDQGLTPAQIKRLTQLARTALAVGQVKAESSKLSDLHADLEDTLAALAAAQGRAWEAFGGHLVGVASALRGHENLNDRATALASRLLLLGHAPAPVAGDAAVAAMPLPERLAALWLTGSDDALAKELLAGPGPHSAEAARYRWTEIRLALARQGNWPTMAQALSQGSAHDLGEYHLEGRLWARSISARELTERLPPLRRVSDRFQAEIDARPELASLLAAVLALESAYGGDRPFYQRLAQALSLPSHAASLARIEWRLLVQASLVRWAVRHRQYVLASVALRDYQQQSSCLSDGLRLDVLGVTADLELGALRARGMPQRVDGKVWAGPPKAAFRRHAGLILLAGKIARVMAAARIQAARAEDAPRREIEQAALARIGALLRTELTTLKGPLQKIGQILSFAVLPFPDALREALADVDSSAPALDPASVQRLLEQNFSGPVTAVFNELDYHAMAAASIGQVHRAALKNGERVVVKIKYPGIDQAVAADLRTLSRFAPLIRRLCPASDVKALLWELKSRLGEECDYRLEARNQEEARLAFAGDPELLIPRVYADRSTDGVLVTEFVDGLAFADFAATADAAAKARAGEAIYRFTMTSLFRRGWLHADPHPGNFLFTADGRVAILDFGCVRRWPMAFVEGIKNLFRSVLEQDQAANQKFWQENGFVGAGTFDFQWQFQVHMQHVFRHVLCDEPNVISEDELKLVVDALLTHNRNLRSTAIPAEHLAMLRVSLGLSAMLSRLQARANWRRVVLPLLYDSPHLYPLKDDTGSASLLP